MLNAVIRFALHNRVLIVFASLVCLVYGSYLATRLPIDVFPDLDRPRVTVMTECPGLSAEDVETLVSAPLESSLLGASGVQDVRSQSVAGLSVVYVEFDWSAEIHRARQTVQERLSAAQPDLPSDVRPQLAPIASLMGQVLHIGLTYRDGPGGGTLYPLPTPGHWAEVVLDPATGNVEVAFLRASGREWEPLTGVERVEIDWRG